MTFRTRIAAIAIALPLTLAGCSDTTPATPAGGTGAPSNVATLQAGQEVDPSGFFEKTQKAMNDARTFSMTMKMVSGPETVTMSGRGDITQKNHQKADMTMTSPAGDGRMHMILDGQAIYMQMPGGSTGGKYVKMPLSALSQAGGQDITTLINPAENVGLTRKAVEKIVYRGTEDKGGARLHHYSLTLDRQKLQQNLATNAPVPQASASSGTLPYEIWTDDANRVRLMTMDVDGTSMTMTVDDYGKPVTIVPPPDASVTQMPGLSGPVTPAPASPAPSVPVPPTTG